MFRDIQLFHDRRPTSAIKINNEIGVLVIVQTYRSLRIRCVHDRRKSLQRKVLLFYRFTLCQETCLNVDASSQRPADEQASDSDQLVQD